MISALIIACFLTSSVSAISCFECINAASHLDCYQIGKLKTCRSGEICQSTFRMTMGAMLITKECMQLQACENNRLQNPSQCKPSYHLNSVCRCCCSLDGCNMDAKLSCGDQWNCPMISSPTHGSISCSAGTKFGSRCRFKCGEGYKVAGKEYTKCTESANGQLMWDHSKTFCKRMTDLTPVSPRTTTQRTFMCSTKHMNLFNGEVHCTMGHKHGSLCSYHCDIGYDLVGANESACKSDGRWSYPVPYCRKVVCPNDQLKVPNGLSWCTKNNNYDSTCYFACNSGYVVKGHSESICQLDGEWSFSKPTCEEVKCSLEHLQLDNGVSWCTEDSSCGSFCYYACFDGFSMYGVDECQCQNNGQWSFPKPSCKKVTCSSSQLSLFNGNADCSDGNEYNSVCSYRCKVGYQIEGIAESLCQKDGEWSYPVPYCRKVACPATHLSLYQGVVGCSDASYYNSTCTYDCNVGYSIEGVTESRCLEDGRWSYPVPRCNQVTCSTGQLFLYNGKSSCTDGDRYGSVCSYQCDEGYNIEGMSESQCKKDGNWSYSAPFCNKVLPECKIDEFPNGTRSCTHGNKSGSKCWHTCDENLMMSGHPLTVCLPTGEWSTSVPVCKPVQCEEISVRNGVISYSNQRLPHSVCHISCSHGYYLQGQHHLSCSPSGHWSGPIPSCEKSQCPPFAKVDLFLVLDSSSSIGASDWSKTLTLITDALSDFEISTESMMVAAVRYHQHVDTESEIELGVHGNLTELVDAIMSLPYDGVGTRTGKALQYVAESMLHSKQKRPDTKSLVVLVTDGISQDEISEPAKQLRRYTDNNIIVLGTANSRGDRNADNLLDISGHPSKTLLLTKSTWSSEHLMNMIADQVC